MVILTTKAPNPHWAYIEKYVLGKTDQKNVHAEKMPNGSVRVYSGLVEIERIVLGKP
jgi:hypothetical protein